jgi:uncharacterized protein (DUF2267 family)
MTFDEFVGAVQHRARLGSLGDAVRAIRCTLGTLSLQLADGEAEDLASQLPEEIGYYLLHAQAGEGLGLPLQEFLDRVSAGEGVDKPQSIHHVRAVLEVLREAVTGGQVEQVLDHLPSDFQPLFTAVSEGKRRLKKVGRETARASAGRQTASRRAPARSGKVTAAAAEASPRSARIARRATGAWHLGR